jgi:hypothetical protein
VPLVGATARREQAEAERHGGRDRSRGLPPRARIPQRRALAGSGDKGDVSGVVGCVIEIKNVQRTALAEWIEEARKEAAAAHAPVWAVWHKRRGKGSPAEWFVTMTGEQFVQLIGEDS